MGSTRKSAWFPNTSRKHATPAAHEKRVARTVFILEDLVTSSRVKRVPPIGALKATARPAPPSAVCIILTSESGSRARLAASAPIAAPMCTVGPSRPSTSPDPMLSTPPMNFAGSSRICGGLASPRKTASTCWMPLPAASGSHRTIRAARVAPRAAAAMGTNQPGPGSLCAQSTRSMRRSSAICRHQRNPPPTNPMTTPATIAVTQIPTVPRIDSSGWRDPAACAVIRRRTLPGQIPPRGIVKRMTEVDHSQHHRDTDHAEHGHAGHHDHVAQFRRLFWVMGVLAIPTVALSPMFAMILGYSVPHFPGSGWVSPVLGTVMYFWGGRPFLTGAISEIRSRAPGMMLLIGLAITVAFVSSWGASLGVLPRNLDFWWELALLIVIMLLGHWIEMRSLAQTTSALDSLAALLPDEAERVTDNGTETVAPSELRVDDVVVVRPGGSVPADAVIVEGAAEMDESMVTGESRTVRRSVGDSVVAGTVATDSGLRVKVTAIGDDTALAGIQRLVTEAQNSSSRAQRLADRAAAWLFWFALGAAVVTAVVWGFPGLGGQPSEAVIRIITVLVIACPHALGLAIPLVVSIATERAARGGVLVKDRLALERMRTVDTVLFDKTGTLTRGEPTVIAFACDADALRLAAAAEAQSEHPLARAIVEAAGRRGLAVPAATDFTSSPAVGVSATVDG